MTEWLSCASLWLFCCRILSSSARIGDGNEGAICENWWCQWGRHLWESMTCCWVRTASSVFRSRDMWVTVGFGGEDVWDILVMFELLSTELSALARKLESRLVQRCGCEERAEEDSASSWPRPMRLLVCNHSSRLRPTYLQFTSFVVCSLCIAVFLEFVNKTATTFVALSSLPDLTLYANPSTCNFPPRSFKLYRSRKQ
jgi:hypothetical protein